MILSALFLNWERAQDMSADGGLSHDELWNLFFRVGFVSERVMPFADAGIRPIVKRIIDLKWLTDECCSGHAGDVRTNPYIGIVFPNQDERELFVLLCKYFFVQNDFGLTVIGDTESNDPYLEDRRKYAGSSEAFAWFHKRCISTFFDWTSTCDADTQEIWKTFSAVLSVYDGKGECVPSVSDLCLYDNCEKGSRLLERVYMKLCRG
jgi:hypothetical protein